MTVDELVTADAILDAFATPGRVLPRKALKQAADNWPEVAAPLLAMLEALANGSALTERSEAILYYGIYLMAQMREARAFRHICAIAAVSEQIDRLIGDGVTEDLPSILSRTYNGDPAPLRALIEGAGADEFARDAALSALAWLTATGRIEREQTASYLRGLHATLQPQDTSWAWVGWQRAISYLGLEDLAPLVADVFEHGWIDEFALSLDDFHGNLQKARQASDLTEIFDPHDRDDGSLDDVAVHLSTWNNVQPEPMRAPAPNRPAFGQFAAPPVRNPYRNVGRNDPCPCGSGTKFKKCCLDKVR